MLGRIPGFHPLRFAPLLQARVTASRVPGSLDCFAARARLHVFARLPNDDHAHVEISDGASVAALKKVVMAELKLQAPPGRVRLLREVGGGGAPVPLDSCRGLAEQGVCEGTRVVVEVARWPLSPATGALPGAAAYYDYGDAAAFAGQDVAPARVVGSGAPAAPPTAPPATLVATVPLPPPQDV